MEEQKEHDQKWRLEQAIREGRYCRACEERPCMCSDPF